MSNSEEKSFVGTRARFFHPHPGRVVVLTRSAESQLDHDKFPTKSWRLPALLMDFVGFITMSVSILTGSFVTQRRTIVFLRQPP